MSEEYKQGINGKEDTDEAGQADTPPQAETQAEETTEKPQAEPAVQEAQNAAAPVPEASVNAYVPAGGAGQGFVPPPSMYAQRRRPLKEKLPLATKVYLWILSVVCVGTTAFFAVMLITHLSAAVLPGADEWEEIPDNPPYSGEYGDDENVPEKKENSNDAIDIKPNLEGLQLNQKPKGQQLSAEEVYAKVVQSTVTVEATMYMKEYEEWREPATGTGIIATADGYIITNSHVVLNSKSTDVTITTYNGEEYEAVVVGVDKTTDLAILKTNDHQFTPAEFGDTENLNIGEWVLAIGNPGGAQFSSSLTRGIISGLNRSVGAYSENGMTYIQTDAAINPGNSGGPLVNMYGQVVGINSSKIVSSGYEGMGFAIPITNAKAIIDELLAGGYVKGRTRLGIKGTDVDSSGYFNGLPMGFQIQEIDTDSAFKGTTAQAGDIIVAIDDQEVSGLSAIGNLLLSYKPGDLVTVRLHRPNAMGTGTGTEFEVTITLLEDKGETQK